MHPRERTETDRKLGGPAHRDDMDANGDSEISPREFLGTPDQFQRLDRDNDGYVEPGEAVNGGHTSVLPETRNETPP